jgi:enamine deaminase RidA (YjgF/YER057c/UK114 family)
MRIEERLEELGITLPKAAEPVAAYKPVVRTGNLLYISGQDCRKDGVLLYEGKIGRDITLEQGQECARQCAINAMAVIKGYLGNLDEVRQIVKLLAFVNSADGFVLQPFVVNGGSELLEKVFGEKGKHARSAIASNELPFNTPVEIEMIVEVEGR